MKTGYRIFIQKVGNTYYWYGVKYNGAVTYYNNPASKNSDTSINSVTCYSSTDLVNWTFEGNVINGATNGSVSQFNLDAAAGTWSIGSGS
ncbi:hypothetical protein [Paenibacillus paridis]|uniref:hypothetical protein n=1 Tax=Paenibacillus paridis TaxID=2583376 RepID=UPI00192E7086|nr:hypothetical protein [Paenibacillus paridis]